MRHHTAQPKAYTSQGRSVAGKSSVYEGRGTAKSSVSQKASHPPPISNLNDQPGRSAGTDHAGKCVAFARV
jgi:hypothetical protein